MHSETTLARSTDEGERAPSDNHLADDGHATCSTGRSTARSRRTPSSVLAEIDAALARIDDGHLRASASAAASRSTQERLEALPVGDALHRRQAQGRARVSRAARGPTSAPGRARTVRRPVLGRRALARAPGRCSGSGSLRSPLAAIARRPADEARRREPARARRGGARRSGPSRSATSRTPGSPSASSRARPRSSIVLTAVAVVWMLVFFARSGARHPVLPGRARAR